MKSLALFLALAATLPCFAQNSVDPNKVVAVVEGIEIKGDEYFSRMERLSGVGTLVGQNFVQLQPGVLTLNQLISEHLLLQIAQSKGLTPKDDEVEAAYREALTENPSLENNWTQSGQPLEGLRYQIKLEVAKFKIVTQGINVTDQQVQNEYATNKSKYTIPKLAKLRILVVDGADKAAADADLTGGKSFIEVVRARSLDISKARDGDYGTVPIESLNEAIRNALKDTKLGNTTDWIKVPTPGSPNSMKFLYENVVPEKVLPFDANLREQIRHRMMLQQGMTKNNIAAIMADARHKAKIEIKDPAFAAAFASLLKQEGNPKEGNGN